MLYKVKETYQIYLKFNSIQIDELKEKDWIHTKISDIYTLKINEFGLKQSENKRHSQWNFIIALSNSLNSKPLRSRKIIVQFVRILTISW